MHNVSVLFIIECNNAIFRTYGCFSNLAHKGNTFGFIARINRTGQERYFSMQKTDAEYTSRKDDLFRMDDAAGQKKSMDFIRDAQNPIYIYPVDFFYPCKFRNLYTPCFYLLLSFSR